MLICVQEMVPMQSKNPIRAYRKAKNISLEAFGASVGVDKSTISRIERGLQNPSTALIRRLMTVSGGELVPDDFFPQDG